METGEAVCTTAGSKQRVSFSTTPLSQGRSTRVNLYKGTYVGPRWGKAGGTCVVKELKHTCAWAKCAWETDVQRMKKAKELAERFTGSTDTAQPIQYVWSDVWKVTRTKPGAPNLGEWVMVEDFIEGTWQNWSSNAGCVDQGTPPTSLQAFSHWTYAHSGGQLLVCDHQGVCHGDKYILANPVVHSVDQEYGPSDLGLLGMAKFFSTHECTNTCMHLSRPSDDLNFSYDFDEHKPAAHNHKFLLSRLDIEDVDELNRLDGLRFRRYA